MSELCCCHDIDQHCAGGWEDPHVHKCLPRAYDLGGHCPDAGCPGRCWAAPKWPSNDTATAAHPDPAAVGGEGRG